MVRIIVTLDRSPTDASFEQLLKAYCPMLVTLVRSMSARYEQFSKAYGSIFVTDGMETDTRFVQFSKACCPMRVTLDRSMSTRA